MNATSQPQTGSVNRNEAAARDAAEGLTVHTGVRGGLGGGYNDPNYNEAPARDSPRG